MLIYEENIFIPSFLWGSMNENRAFLVLTAIVNKENMAEVPDYLGKVMSIFGKSEGKPFGIFKTTKNLYGDDSPEMLGIIEFPNSDLISEVVNSEDFKGLFETRDRVFNKLNFVISEEM